MYIPKETFYVLMKVVYGLLRYWDIAGG